MSPSTPLTLDVREDLRNGQEPFGKIMAAIGQLEPDQSLRLLATFEPIPLFRVLGAKGYTHQATRLGEGDWEVIFTPKGAAPAGPEAAAAPAGADPAKALPAAAQNHPAPAAGDGEWPAPTQTLDNRGLMPPEPMVRVLEALEHLAPGTVLEVFNDREPRFLYPELEKRNHAVRTEKRSEGVRLLIRCGRKG
ncbi:MAG TPA: DUF2249 domain-containing protein [Limnochordia bacterium]|nr:DUF2249 domain-containing protein [Limnochordia bacterium]